MSAVVFRGTVVLPDRLLEGGAVLCENGRIAAVGRDVEAPRGSPEVDGAFISPGSSTSTSTAATARTSWTGRSTRS
ncbi:MAG TPA: hypothetical protein VJT84_05190 [Gaiellaceae bacterium]|nr:hypothetical protein [Gaiellaceae bacterium]